MSGNVATVSLGTSSRQFVKLATGDWLSTGGGYAKLSQTGTRVPYEYKCTYSPPPYAMARGWNIAVLWRKRPIIPGPVGCGRSFERTALRRNSLFSRE